MTINQQSIIAANQAIKTGGGIDNREGAIVIVQNSHLVDNSADGFGGGLYLGGLDGVFSVSQSRLLGNAAGVEGGALYQERGTSSVTESCVVANSGTALVYDLEFGEGPPIAATHNWWGVADGPAGAGPGSGDSVSQKVDFTAFQTAPIMDCPTLEHLFLPFAQRE